jgi:integrase
MGIWIMVIYRKRKNPVYLHYVNSRRNREAIGPIIVLALYTDVRKSEALKLKWDDIDLREKIIWVRNSKT